MDVKEAVEVATKHFEDLYPTTSLRDVLLEEVELSEDEQTWLVTLGFDRKLPGTLGAIGANEYSRAYKLFKIDDQTGKVYSVTMRKV